MKDFGKYGDKCPKCNGDSFEYGATLKPDGETIVASGKCNSCGYTAPEGEWSVEKQADASHHGWSLLDQAYNSWCGE